MRPAYLFAETAAKFESSVELVRNEARIDGKSVLSILTLGAAQGTELLLETIGPDAERALSTLVDLVAAGFPGEEAQSQANAP